MNTWMVILIVVLFFLLFILFSVIIYMKLCELEKDIDGYWQELILVIEKRYELIEEWILSTGNKKMESEVKELLKRGEEKKIDSVFFNTYVEIENRVKNFLIALEDQNKKEEKWDLLLRENKEILDQKRYQYNQRVLRINRFVEMFPFCIIAKIHSFPKYPYFRSEL